jgi:hypothetical protein
MVDMIHYAIIVQVNECSGSNSLSDTLGTRIELAVSIGLTSRSPSNAPMCMTRC